MHFASHWRQRIFPLPGSPSPVNLGLTLALAVVAASDTPVLLLDENLVIVAASHSFCAAFEVDATTIAGRALYDINHHHWDVPRLRSLFAATIAGLAEVDAYEIDLAVGGQEARRLVLKAQKLEYGIDAAQRLLLTINDVTQVRHEEAQRLALVQENGVLLHEMQHRVANSLQIIASILMQSARKVQSDEARGHLANAHQRVMSIATLQRQLAESGGKDVALEPYLSQLCISIGASMIFDHDKLAIVTNVDGTRVESEISISLGLVVTELVINSLKHGFPGDRAGCITVEYANRDDDWTLTVRDNGVGMPENPVAAQAGLGTNIIQALAKQLHADIHVTDLSPGTKVSLVHVERIAVRDAANDAAESIAV